MREMKDKENILAFFIYLRPLDSGDYIIKMDRMDMKYSFEGADIIDIRISQNDEIGFVEADFLNGRGIFSAIVIGFFP